MGKQLTKIMAKTVQVTQKTVNTICRTHELITWVKVFFWTKTENVLPLNVGYTVIDEGREVKI